MSCSVYESGLVGRQESLFSALVYVSLNPLLSGSSNFFGSSVCFAKSMISEFHGHCLRTACESSSGGEKIVLYIVGFAYSLVVVVPVALLVFALLSY